MGKWSEVRGEKVGEREKRGRRDKREGEMLNRRYRACESGGPPSPPGGGGGGSAWHPTILPRFVAAMLSQCPSVLLQSREKAFIPRLR